MQGLNFFVFFVSISWVKVKKMGRGRISAGFKGYLENIWGNPSLAQKNKEKQRTTKDNIFVFICP